MPVYITTVRQHAHTLATAKERSRDLAHALRDALGKANGFTDPDLTPEALQRKRDELASTFREAARADLEKLQSEVTSAREGLAKYARENMQLPNDPAALIRAEQKWRHVERILDAGGDLRAEIAKADYDTVLAIAEFAPSWAAAQSTRPREGLSDAVQAAHGGPTPDQFAGLRNAILRRTAAVTPDPALAELLNSEAAAEGQMAVAAPWLTAAEGLIDRGPVDLLGVALASQVAESESAQAA